MEIRRRGLVMQTMVHQSDYRRTALQRHNRLSDVVVSNGIVGNASGCCIEKSQRFEGKMDIQGIYKHIGISMDSYDAFPEKNINPVFAYEPPRRQ